MISSRLWTSELPDPDLVIRTSGEQRISNFLPMAIGLCGVGISRYPLARFLQRQTLRMPFVSSAGASAAMAPLSVAD